MAPKQCATEYNLSSHQDSQWVWSLPMKLSVLNNKWRVVNVEEIRVKTHNAIHYPNGQCLDTALCPWQ